MTIVREMAGGLAVLAASRPGRFAMLRPKLFLKLPLPHFPALGRSHVTAQPLATILLDIEERAHVFVPPDGVFGGAVKLPVATPAAPGTSIPTWRPAAHDFCRVRVRPICTWSLAVRREAVVTLRSSLPARVLLALNHMYVHMPQALRTLPRFGGILHFSRRSLGNRWAGCTPVAAGAKIRLAIVQAAVDEAVVGAEGRHRSRPCLGAQCVLPAGRTGVRRQAIRWSERLEQRTKHEGCADTARHAGLDVASPPDCNTPASSTSSLTARL